MENSSKYSYKKNLYEFLEEAAETYSERTALVFRENSITYDELNRKANQIANYLILRGVKPNDKVGIAMTRSIDLVAGIFGILKSGGVYVPVETDYPKERIAYMLEKAKAHFLLTNMEDSIQSCMGLKYKEIPFGDISVENPEIKREPGDLAYIIYTSGSSGRPKGVMIEQHSVVNLIECLNRMYSITSSDVALCVTSACFDLSVYDFFGILAAGGKVVIASKEQMKDSGSLKKCLLDYKVTFWNSVPTTMASLMDNMRNGEEISDLKNIFLSGDWIRVDTVKKIQHYCKNALVTSLGGATEATVWSVFYPIKEVKEKWPSIPYGKALQNNFLYILNADGTKVLDGEIGELYIGGCGVARGYADDEEKTKAAFQPDPFRKPERKMYRTGDLGRWMKDGNIEFLGRKDDQVKIRGFRVELKEIEKAAMTNPKIQNIVVTARKNGYGENVLCAYFTGAASISLKEFQHHLGKFLPEYMIPSILIHLEKFPFNRNGKVDIKALPDLDMHYMVSDTVIVPAATELQKKLQKIWEKVLGIKGIGIRNDFFLLGGTSLTAVMLQNEAEEQSITLTYRDIYQYKTIEEQEAFLTGRIVKTSIRKEYSVTEGKEKIKPFNTLYYKNCFYNALFPVLASYGIPAEAVMCHDIFSYCYLPDKKMIGLYTIEEVTLKKLFEELGVEAEFAHKLTKAVAREKTEQALKEKQFSIVFVDSYYEPNRRDTFQRKHFAHTLLVYGKTENGYLVLEHSHGDALNYREQVIPEYIIWNAYEGYLKNLCKPEETYSMLRFKEKYEINTETYVDYKKKFLCNFHKNKAAIEAGVCGVREFASVYEAEDINMEECLKRENELIDGRRAEKYFANAVMGEITGLDALYETVIKGWEEIRNDTVRITKGLVLKDYVREKHIELLQSICEAEQEIIKKYDGVNVRE